LEVEVEYCSRQDLRFAGASVAVGAGRVGAVVLGVIESVVGLDSESEVEEVGGAADFLPVSWDTRTPIATDARMIKSRASPHYLLAFITWRKIQTHSPHHPLSLDSLFLLLLVPPCFTDTDTSLSIYIPSFPTNINPY
jgi:hypothetical protein